MAICLHFFPKRETVREGERERCGRRRRGRHHSRKKKAHDGRGGTDDEGCALNPARACENTFQTSSSFVVDFDFPPFVGVALDTKERVARMLEATISSAYLADEVDKEEDKERLRGMVEKKEDGTPVTAADFAIQTLMENVLGGDGEEVVGEERRPVEGDASFDRVKELVEKFTPRGRIRYRSKRRGVVLAGTTSC